MTAVVHSPCGDGLKILGVITLIHSMGVMRGDYWSKTSRPTPLQRERQTTNLSGESAIFRLGRILNPSPHGDWTKVVTCYHVVRLFVLQKPTTNCLLKHSRTQYPWHHTISCKFSHMSWVLNPNGLISPYYIVILWQKIIMKAKTSILFAYWICNSSRNRWYLRIEFLALTDLIHHRRA